LGEFIIQQGKQFDQKLEIMVINVDGLRSSQASEGNPRIPPRHLAAMQVPAWNVPRHKFSYATFGGPWRGLHGLDHVRQSRTRTGPEE